ncbi:MAG: phosphatidylglycerol lysyltransferase [Treponema sp.]|jgi:phosphoglucomutase|nr:phosphatidylglycerol lysyltransferase [Treponema sp.]
MLYKEELTIAIEAMIFSASGWRGVFAADGNEESKSAEISKIHEIICGAAALVFEKYLQTTDNNPVVKVGIDTRPTGRAIAGIMIRILTASGCRVEYTGITAAPEIMASSAYAAGFIYISASHNPIGHNGIKFGLRDGGVLAPAEAAKLILNFRSFMDNEDGIEQIENLIKSADPYHINKVYKAEKVNKSRALKAYYKFCTQVVWDYSESSDDYDAALILHKSLRRNPLGIVCDFNGSARTVSIDKRFFLKLGLKFRSINNRSGEIAHRIVPEGESLEPCRRFLDEMHKRDMSFKLGYVPDCDGDRGNLVIWDDSISASRSLEAQEVFALACVAEFSYLVWTGKLYAGVKAAVAVNDPTSMRIDRIADMFGIDVFRAEVGEANVVGLARKLRAQGYLVRILGEGSAGGNITHPSAVRDPLNTVLALVKLLTLRDNAGKKGLFRIWCDLCGQGSKYRENFNLNDIISSLPSFITTAAYDGKAVLRVNSKDHSVLKNRYQKVFMCQWEERKDFLKTRYGINSWEAFAYNGMDEKRNISRFGEAGKGGLKINFYDNNAAAIASIWMRGSATEPVFRIMADVQGGDKSFERDLIDWQRRMVTECDITE